MSEASEVDLVVQEAKKLWRGRLWHPDAVYGWQVQVTSHGAYGYKVFGMSDDADRIFVSSVLPWGVAQQVLESVQKMEQGHQESPRAVEFGALKAKEAARLREKEQAKINEPPPVIPVREIEVRNLPKSLREQCIEALKQGFKDAYGPKAHEVTAPDEGWLVERYISDTDPLFRREYPASPEEALLLPGEKVTFVESGESRLVVGPDIIAPLLGVDEGKEPSEMVTFGPVRREQIRETGGDRSFGPVLSKEPYKQLSMDCRDAPPMSRLHRMAEPHGYLSKIPGARNDWAPAQVVTYEQDLGEDLELSDAELRAWAKR